MVNTATHVSAVDWHTVLVVTLRGFIIDTCTPYTHMVSNRVRYVQALCELDSCACSKHIGYGAKCTAAHSTV